VIDTIVFADEVSALLKGKFANLPKQEKAAAFDYAFNEVANEWHIQGASRCALKSTVGTILSKRPRKARAQTEVTTTTHDLPSFEVLESDNRSYVIFRATGPSPSLFRFIPKGWTTYQGTPGKILLAHACIFAKTFFEQCATRASAARITKLEASKTHLSLVLDGSFEMHFIKGKRGVCASVTKLRVPCKQKDIPRELLCTAREIATTYFKDVDTLPLHLE